MTFLLNNTVKESEIEKDEANISHSVPITGTDMSLVHEIWLEPDENGQMLPGLCLCGPMGDAFRALLDESAIKISEIKGRSHFETMVRYHEFLGCEAYTSHHPEDFEPYPEEWLHIQYNFLRESRAARPACKVLPPKGEN